jgi:hypothetical protein
MEILNDPNEWAKIRNLTPIGVKIRVVLGSTTFSANRDSARFRPSSVSRMVGALHTNQSGIVKAIGLGWILKEPTHLGDDGMVGVMNGIAEVC